jgi:NADH:ubiquinone oxidoreductase subunit 6 (subunit J)
MTLDALTLFGVAALSVMLICYALERRSPWFILGMALSCLAAAAYGFLQGAWPFGVLEVIWAGIALRRWSQDRKNT